MSDKHKKTAGGEDFPNTEAHVTLDGVVFRDCVLGAGCTGGENGRRETVTLTISRCEFLGPQRDCIGKPPVDLRNDRIEVGKSCGVHVSCLACVTVTDCVLDGWRRCAQVKCGVEAEFQRCLFTVTEPGCVCAESTGKLTALECEFRGSPRDVEACGAGELLGVNLLLGFCEVRLCRFVGLTGCAISVERDDDLAMIRLFDTTVERGLGPPCQYGLCMVGAATARMQDCQFKGVEVGVCVCGGVVSTNRVRVDGAARAVQLIGTGLRVDAQFLDTDLQAEGLGVEAVGRHAEAVLSSCRICDTAVGVGLYGGAVGSVGDSTIVRGKVGVMVGGDPDRQGGLVGGWGRVCGLTAPRIINSVNPILPAGTGKGVARTGARCDDPGIASGLTICGVDVENMTAGLVVHVDGVMVASGVVVRDSKVGFVVLMEEEELRLESCKAIGCRRGSVHVQVLDELESDDHNWEQMQEADSQGLEILPSSEAAAVDDRDA